LDQNPFSDGSPSQVIPVATPAPFQQPLKPRGNIFNLSVRTWPRNPREREQRIIVRETAPPSLTISMLPEILKAAGETLLTFSQPTNR
jgi:hypothetical protein